ncbi:putative phage repressor [Nitrobacter hamburgensis X14]|uniref:Putative phage repressor n=1 Tax=Nitrobacter hamburgensis (strain DSM 10229 / NCIMB 13809 / X14) TaxID=323097 RepID=Q1QI64_NITHX|nr:S24 family peptidase [Nitrobacter hamburgensis]ABE64083.1 putative phage repressor [Nitrobacter hamburgensis X14]
MDDLKTIVARIEARLEEMGTNPAAASRAAGLSPGAIRNLQRGAKGEIKLKGASGKTLSALAEYLQVPLDWLMSGSGEPGKPQVIRPAGPERSTVVDAPNAPRLSEFGDFDVEVRGISVGGGDDEFYFNGDVIDHLRRPPGILRAKNVFALNVAGDSMMPRYEPGEPIYVQRANPVIGDYVVVELYPEIEGQAGKSFLKKLVRRTGRRVTCSQLNPPKELEFDTGEVKEIYRVLKPRDLLG